MGGARSRRKYRSQSYCGGPSSELGTLPSDSNVCCGVAQVKTTAFLICVSVYTPTACSDFCRRKLSSFLPFGVPCRAARRGTLNQAWYPPAPFRSREAPGNSFAYLFITPSWCFQRAKAWPSSVLDVRETSRAYRPGPLFFPSLIWTHPHRHPFTFLYFFFQCAVCA